MMVLKLQHFVGMCCEERARCERGGARESAERGDCNEIQLARPRCCCETSEANALPGLSGSTGRQLVCPGSKRKHNVLVL